MWFSCSITGEIRFRMGRFDLSASRDSAGLPGSVLPWGRPLAMRGRPLGRKGAQPWAMAGRTRALPDRGADQALDTLFGWLWFCLADVSRLRAGRPEMAAFAGSGR